MVAPIPPNQIQAIYETVPSQEGFAQGVGQAFATWSAIIYYDDNGDLQMVRVSDNAYLKFHAFYKFRIPPTQNRLYVLPPRFNRPTPAQCAPVIVQYLRDNLASWEASQYWDFRVDSIPIPIDYSLYQSLWSRPRNYSFTP